MGKARVLAEFWAFLRHEKKYWLMPIVFVFLLFGILLVFTGVQLVTSGLLAELIARTYHESQDKPIFVIRRTLPSESPVLRESRTRVARTSS